MSGGAKNARDPFAVAAVFLAAVAFAGSFDHTLATVQDHGQGGWVAVATALMPEVSVALSVLRIRKGGRPAQVRWAWLVLVSSAAFTLWANLEQAQPSVGGLVVGGWPAWAAIGAAGFIEMSGPGREQPARAARPPAPARPKAAAVERWGDAPGVVPAPAGLALVPPAAARGLGPRVGLAVADALAWRASSGGGLPSLSQLEQLGDGHARKTAQRALKHIEAQEAAA